MPERAFGGGNVSETVSGVRFVSVSGLNLVFLAPSVHFEDRLVWEGGGREGRAFVQTGLLRFRAGSTFTHTHTHMAGNSQNSVKFGL
jgi:hypothetical protein